MIASDFDFGLEGGRACGILLSGMSGSVRTGSITTTGVASITGISCCSAAESGMGSVSMGTGVVLISTFLFTGFL